MKTRIAAVALFAMTATAHGQSAGTLNLSGPSSGGSIITPATVNAAVNAALAAKADASNPAITGTLSVTGAATVGSLAGDVSGANVIPADTGTSASLASAVGARLLKPNNLADLPSASTARTNLGLGTLATQNAASAAITGGTISGANVSGANVTAAGGTTARTAAAMAADVSNAIGFGADPTGVADSSAAINLAAAARRGGTAANVYLPAGTYKLQHSVTIGPNQCLVGDNLTSTILTVDQSFDPAATGVIILSGREITGSARAPCIRNVQIQFAQPTTQTSRANFLTLSQGCTSGAGGSGCKYPPAIDATTSNRLTLEGVAIVAAWDGINATGNTGGMWIENTNLSAFDYGLSIDGALDFVHVKGYHFWPFGLSANLATIFTDGNTYAMKIGKADGAEFADVTTINSRIAVLADASNPVFSNLALDSNSTFEVAGGMPIVTGGYVLGNAPPVCPINVTGGSLFLTNMSLGAAVTDLCVSGSGFASVIGGDVQSLVQTQPAATVSSGGQLEIRGVHIAVNPGYTWSPSLFQATGTGILSVMDTTFPTMAVAAGPAVTIATDNAANYVANNHFNGWTFVAPGNVGGYGPNNRDYVNYPANTLGIGPGALANSGTSNVGSTALGSLALNSSAPGANSTAVGANALKLATGVQNTAVGQGALASLTTATNNTAVGQHAAASLTGGGNTVAGQNALGGAGNANNNVALGINAGDRIFTGASNVVLGPNVASTTLATGSNNILIGTSSAVDAATSSTSNYLNIGGLITGAMPGSAIQMVTVAGGVQISPGAAPPTCGATYRGTEWFTAGAAGVKDTFQVCAKDATDAYAWRTLY